ncbi:MAG: hypothetical protein COW55_01990 [Rhodobacteraceae bacterium CG17_big_fil_post_rev_8_21_14_2_50_65_11]|nr:MAG: hypothetical protein COW55_01990 [Rhodobacteraceae bacterium CG17_big_fil_post_rev_8_21_14_2_50_65_11]
MIAFVAIIAVVIVTFVMVIVMAFSVSLHAVRDSPLIGTAITVGVAGRQTGQRHESGGNGCNVQFFRHGCGSSCLMKTNWKLRLTSS